MPTDHPTEPESPTDERLWLEGLLVGIAIGMVIVGLAWGLS